MGRRRGKRTEARGPADSLQAAFQAKRPNTTTTTLIKSDPILTIVSMLFFVKSYSGVSWKTEKKSLLSKGNNGWVISGIFFQESYALRVLYLNRRFRRYGPDPKTKTYTFTLSSCSCWIPRSWSKLKSQSLACVKRGWFYREATRTLLLCLIFSCSQKLGTSWSATFADEVVWVWFPIHFTFSWQCSLLQDQEDGL